MSFAESLKREMRKIFMVRYFQDGKVQLCWKLPLYTVDWKKQITAPLPIKFNVRSLYKMFYASKPIVPNKIVFDNYMGKGFGCNPKYVALKLLEKYPGQFDIVWLATKKNNNGFPEGIRVVDYASRLAREEFATAKVWISNYHKISFIKKGMYKRPGQYYIQMWHGSLGIKKIENDVKGLTVNTSWLNMAKLNSYMTDYWISNSDFETAIYKRAFWDVENVLEYGHPRDDILLGDTSEARQKVAQTYGIEGKKILFYAPTFREDYRLDCYQIDYLGLQKELAEKFGGEWAILVRLHPRVQKYASLVIPKNDTIFDATNYQDIQELLAAADCMISDYSSCIFDYVLTHRPALIYAPDLEKYNTERGFYYPLEETPFPIAHDNFQLLEYVKNFDLPKYEKNCDEFLKEKGCMEDGRAAERVADLIYQLVNGQKVECFSGKAE